MRHVILLVLLIFGLETQAQKQSWNQSHIELIDKIVSKYHYAHYPIDTLSNRFFYTFLQNATEGNPIFTKTEFEKYQSQKETIFKNALSGDTRLLEELYLAIMKRRAEIVHYLNTSKTWDAKPQKGAKLVESESRYYTGSTTLDVYEYIKNQCYVEMMHAAYDLCDVEDKTLDAACVQKNIDELLSQFLIEKHGSQYFADSVSMYEGFCQAWIASLDPHSAYQNISEKKKYDESLSTKENNFGVYIAKNDEGKLEIAAVIPGSAAWQSDKIKEGDEVRAIQFGTKDALKLYFMNEVEISQELSKNADKILHLELKKEDGNIEKVDLESSEIVNVDNLFQAYIFQNKYKIGYIALPSFYDSWDIKDASNSSSNDLSKAIIKLNQDSADALVLDLRFNGGGSMDQAIEIAGLFVDVGPVAIERFVDSKAETLKDTKRGTLFSKPLIILINEYSASASEFLASALQDLGRALIVGNTSYGKASIQVAIPVHKDALGTVVRPDLLHSDEYLHLTIGKYYRITGKSLQKVGVIPDVVLPGYLADIVSSEAKEPYALVSDTVLKKTYYTPTQIQDVSTIQAASTARLDTASYVKKCAIFSSFIKDKKVRYSVPLTTSEFISYYQEILSKIENLKNTESNISIQNTSYDKQLFEKDIFAKRLNDNAIQEMKEDFFLNETICIMKDFLTLIK